MNYLLLNVKEVRCNMENLKIRVYNLIREDDENDIMSTIIDWFIILLITLNTLFIIVDISKIPEWARVWSPYIESASVVIFTIEYILRVWTSTLIRPNLEPSKARAKYVFSFMAMVDLFSVLPFYLPFVLPSNLQIIRTLRLMRMLRLLKLNRYTDALKIIARVFKKKSHQLISSVIIIMLITLISSVLVYNIEKEVQPEVFDNVFSGMWWAIITVTSIGYGDMYPITPMGKLISAIVGIVGIISVAILTGVISAGFIDVANSKKEKKEDKKHFCPYCGKKIS